MGYQKNDTPTLKKIDKFKLTNLDTTISQRVNDTTFPSYKKQLGQLNE